jgi:hypothetical protein
MKSILTIALILTSFLVKAQPDAIGDFNKHVIEKWTEDYIRVSQYRVKGSPYLLGESFDGEITMRTGLKISNQKVLYDIMDQRVGTEMNKQLVEPLSKSSAKGFLNVIASGPKISFLRQYKTRLVPDPLNMYSKELRIFEQYYEYYLYNHASQKLEKIKLKEKDIREALQGFNIPPTAYFTKQGDIKAIVESINH